MLKVIIGIIIGYFVGMFSCILQVVKIEDSENMKFEEIMKFRKG